MKAPCDVEMARLNCLIRPDIKEAMEEVARRRKRAGGGYVGLTRVFYEAAVMFLESEGIVIDSDPGELPVRKPAKSVARRKVAAVRA